MQPTIPAKQPRPAQRRQGTPPRASARAWQRVPRQPAKQPKRPPTRLAPPPRRPPRTLAKARRRPPRKPLTRLSKIGQLESAANCARDRRAASEVCSRATSNLLRASPWSSEPALSEVEGSPVL